MTVEELIARLEDIRDELGGDTEVRLMTQQSWPFENTIYGLCSSKEIAEACDEEEKKYEPEPEGCKRALTHSMKKDPSLYRGIPAVLFIVEGTQLGYGTKKAWEVCS